MGDVPRLIPFFYFFGLWRSLVSARGWGPRGRRFESGQSDTSNSIAVRVGASGRLTRHPGQRHCPTATVGEAGRTVDDPPMERCNDMGSHRAGNTEIRFGVVANTCNPYPSPLGRVSTGSTILCREASKLAGAFPRLVHPARNLLGTSGGLLARRAGTAGVFGSTPPLWGGGAGSNPAQPTSAGL